MSYNVETQLKQIYTLILAGTFYSFDHKTLFYYLETQLNQIYIYTHTGRLVSQFGAQNHVLVRGLI